MRIVIIGGSSFSTPKLLKFLDSEKPPRKMEIVLAGKTPERIKAVSRASRLLIGGQIDVRTELIHSDNWGKILDSADAVVIQIRVGGFEARLFDETFPNKYRLCGDEGLGVGGLSIGWRTWPVLAPILEAIAKFCPQTSVILLTSPLGLLVRASCKYADLNLVGICELPWTALQDLSQSLGMISSEVQADYLGVNHLGWFFNIRSGTRDLLNDLAARDLPFPTSQFLRTHRCFPTRYLRMHYQPDLVLTEQIAQKTPRAAVLKNIQSWSYEVFGKGQPTEIARALDARATPWYTEAVGPLLLAQSGHHVELPFFVSVPNGTYVSFLEKTDVIESRHHWVQGRLLRSPLTSAPPRHVVENLEPVVQFERIATDAIMNRSLKLLGDALSVHPWTRGHPKLESIVNEIVTTNNSMLSACA